MSEWKPTQYPGVRYREHETRKHHGKADRYFAIRYKRHGKSVEEGAGWASQKVNAQKANGMRSDIIQNIREGKRPQSLKEKREIDLSLRKAEEKEQKKTARENITFDQLTQKYLEWAKNNKKDSSHDETRYRLHLSENLGNKSLKYISSNPLLLEKLKRDLQKKGLSPATVKHCLVLVRQIFNKAIAWNLFQGTNPIRKIKLPKLDNKRVRFLTHKEADDLLTALQEKSKDVHNLAYLALHTGLRFGEIASLTVGDIDFTNNIVQVKDAKAGSRQAYMTEEVKNMLLDRLPAETKMSNLVFPNTQGGTLKRMDKIFKETVDEIGLNNEVTSKSQRAVFHSLRHTFASWLAINGTPLYTIKELMGHKTLTMTERYAHLIPDHKNQAVKDMAETFRKAQKNEKAMSLTSEVKHG